MTVDGTLIALLSPYTVGDTADITSTALTSYISLTNDEMERVPSTVSTSVRDMMQAFLILELFEFSRGNMEMSHEQIGDYAYTRATPGISSYRMKFEKMLTQAMGDDAASEGVERTDAAGSFPLDRNTTPGMI